MQRRPALQRSGLIALKPSPVRDYSSTILLRLDTGQSILPIANRVNEEHSRRWTLKLPLDGMFRGRMRFKRLSLTFDLPRIQCVPLSRLLAYGTFDEKRSYVPDRVLVFVSQELSFLVRVR